MMLTLSSFAQSGIGSDNGSSQTKIIKSYPNPASSVVTFEFQRSYSRAYSIRVLNSIGKQVYEAQNMPSSLRIDLREEKFYRGIYIYQLVNKYGVVIESGKIYPQICKKGKTGTLGDNATRMIVIAGPPGSGKSSIFPVSKFEVPFFNADDRAAHSMTVPIMG